MTSYQGFLHVRPIALEYIFASQTMDLVSTEHIWHLPDWYEKSSPLQINMQKPSKTQLRVCARAHCRLCVAQQYACVYIYIEIINRLSQLPHLHPTHTHQMFRLTKSRPPCQTARWGKRVELTWYPSCVPISKSDPGQKGLLLRWWGGHTKIGSCVKNSWNAGVGFQNFKWSRKFYWRHHRRHRHHQASIDALL